MSELPTGLAKFIEAVAADEQLLVWFESLEDVPSQARAAEFRYTASRMRAGGEHEELAHATALLAAPGIYESVLAEVRRQTAGR